MAITTEPPPKKVLPKPEVLRQNVVKQLQRLPDEGALPHDLTQELELHAAWADFSEGLAQGWSAGKYEDLDAALASARAAIRESRPG